jgi:hypothetical protein
MFYFHRRLSMFHSILKSHAFIRKVYGITFTLTFCLSSLQGQPTKAISDTNQHSLVSGQARVQSEIEKQSNKAKEEAQKKLVPEAIAVIEATKRAIAFAKDGQTERALSEIEQATGKVDVLLARHPKDALLPINFSLNIINTAPIDIDLIKKIGRAAEVAVKDKNYPEARLLLNDLQSEINLTFYSLPLGLYPAALKSAANLLDQKRANESINVLETALNTLVVINQVTPIPIINSIILISMAEDEENQGHNKDKDAVSKFLNLAKYEIDRAKELGYKGDDEGYASLNDAIKSIKENIEHDQNNTSTFASLKERLKTFLKRISGEEKNSNTAVKN